MYGDTSKALIDRTLEELRDLHGGRFHFTRWNSKFLNQTIQKCGLASSKWKNLKKKRNILQHLHAYIRTCIHTSIHACTHAYIHTYIHTSHPFIHPSINSFIHPSIHPIHPIHLWFNPSMHTFIHTEFTIQFKSLGYYP